MAVKKTKRKAKNTLKVEYVTFIQTGITQLLTLQI